MVGQISYFVISWLFLILGSTHCFANWALHYFYTFAKWYKQLCKTAIAKSNCNMRSTQCQEIKKARFLVFLYEIFFLLGHFNFQYILKNPWWYSKSKSEHFTTKDLLKITNEHCYMQQSKILQIHAEKK